MSPDDARSTAWSRVNAQRLRTRGRPSSSRFSPGVDEQPVVDGEPVVEVVDGHFLAEFAECLSPSDGNIGDGEVRVTALGEQSTSA